MLIVADTHFGKDGIFRQHAIPIPTGDVAHDLQRLGRLLAETGARRLMVLGDFIHGAMDKEQPFIHEFTTWRRQHAALHIDVVLGNHDRHIDMSLYDNINWHNDYVDGAFCFSHEPRNHHNAYVLSGHIHPVMRLTASRGDVLRLPVFWFQEQQGTLPSFGSMTGGYAITPAADDRLYAVGPDTVLPIR